MNLYLDLPEPVLDELVERVAARVLEELRAGKPAESEYVTPDQAAEILCCKRQRIYDLASNGRLERVKEGGRTLHRRADVVALALPHGSASRIGTGGAR